MLKKIIALFFAVLIAIPAYAAPDSTVSDEDDEGQTISLPTINLPIIMYHHISADSSRWNDYVVSVAEFEADMKYLKENGWQSISVSNLLDWYDGKYIMPDKPFMITFDDGFESTIKIAEPMLVKYGFCGVVAVIGSICERFSKNNDSGHEWSHMSWEETAEMSRRGVIEVQCHTWDMHQLKGRRGCTRRSDESVINYRYNLSADISKFLQECRKNNVQLTPAIAYPFGIFCNDTTNAVHDLGLLAAFTCDSKINILTGNRDELYHLGRFNRAHGAKGEKIFKLWEENC